MYHDDMMNPISDEDRVRWEDPKTLTAQQLMDQSRKAQKQLFQFQKCIEPTKWVAEGYPEQKEFFLEVVLNLEKQVSELDDIIFMYEEEMDLRGLEYDY